MYGIAAADLNREVFILAVSILMRHLTEVIQRQDRVGYSTVISWSKSDVVQSGAGLRKKRKTDVDD